ncbi:MAG: hypothetical protein QMD53_04155 [Actinomycetota bacterium]|nr:hypothetical protein [Actinomycetota bacterium]
MSLVSPSASLVIALAGLAILFRFFQRQVRKEIHQDHPGSRIHSDRSLSGGLIFWDIETGRTQCPRDNQLVRLGLLALNAVAGTTLIYELFGPASTKWAIFKAGEVPEELKHWAQL